MLGPVPAQMRFAQLITAPMNTVTLTKADLVKQLVDQLGLNRRKSVDMVDAFYEEIARKLEGGREVKLSGFGCFSLKHKGARQGRNPRTGVEATISARRVVI